MNRDWAIMMTAVALIATAAGCPSPQGAQPVQALARPQIAMTQAIFRDPAEAALPDTLAEFLRTAPEWRGGRLIMQSDFDQYDQAWFTKMGYASFVEEDFENDGHVENAAVIVQGGRAFVIIIHLDPVGTWKTVFKEEIPGGRAMLRVESIAGMRGGKCVLVAGGHKGFRMSVCWDGANYLKITL
jgi:hypothetical protein